MGSGLAPLHLSCMDDMPWQFSCMARPIRQKGQSRLTSIGGWIGDGLDVNGVSVHGFTNFLINVKPCNLTLLRPSSANTAGPAFRSTGITPSWNSAPSTSISKPESWNSSKPTWGHPRFKSLGTANLANQANHEESKDESSQSFHSSS